MRNKTVLLLLFCLCSVVYVMGQTPAADTTAPEYGWQKEMVAGLNLTQTSFDNYVQGGENTMTWQLNTTFKFVNDQEKTNWSNSGKFNYGMSKSGKEESKKSIDEIKLETVYVYKLGINIDPYIAGVAESQFGPGYDYAADPKVEISNFADPIYFRESAGFGYKPKPEIATRLGFAIKQTLTDKYPVPFADDPKTPGIEKTKNEYGIESVTDLDFKVSANSKITSKLELFSNLKTFEQVDVNWDTILVAQVTKYINLNFNVKMLYDKDISKKRQLKQALAAGISYSFF